MTGPEFHGQYNGQDVTLDDLRELQDNGELQDATNRKFEFLKQQYLELTDSQSVAEIDQAHMLTQEIFGFCDVEFNQDTLKAALVVLDQCFTIQLKGHDPVILFHMLAKAWVIEQEEG